ncbi:MAG: hypothetical protein JRN37_06640 [Nitrososphaerota archaeon]|nr:hypothetical protein [Nitrososphaerota archaeon]MDG7038814.1 hypothetical protein [Nitrososphaerota archaeon]
MKPFICPVFHCGEKVKPNNASKHVRQYQLKHKGEVAKDGKTPISVMHDLWANYYFHELWNSNLDLETKWAEIYLKAIQQEREMKKRKIKSKNISKMKPNETLNPKEGYTISTNERGMIEYNGHEYTLQEFFQAMEASRKEVLTI